MGVRFADYLRPGANISELMKTDFVWMILLAALGRGFRPGDPAILDVVFLLCDSTEEDIDEGTERVIRRTKRCLGDYDDGHYSCCCDMLCYVGKV